MTGAASFFYQANRAHLPPLRCNRPKRSGGSHPKQSHVSGLWSSLAQRAKNGRLLWFGARLVHICPPCAAIVQKGPVVLTRSNRMSVGYGSRRSSLAHGAKNGRLEADSEQRIIVRFCGIKFSWPVKNDWCCFVLLPTDSCTFTPFRSLIVQKGPVVLTRSNRMSVGCGFRRSSLAHGTKNGRLLWSGARLVRELLHVVRAVALRFRPRWVENGRLEADREQQITVCFHASSLAGPLEMTGVALSLCAREACRFAPLALQSSKKIPEACSK